MQVPCNYNAPMIISLSINKFHIFKVHFIYVYYLNTTQHALPLILMPQQEVNPPSQQFRKHYLVPASMPRTGTKLNEAKSRPGKDWNLGMCFFDLSFLFSLNIQTISNAILMRVQS